VIELISVTVVEPFGNKGLTLGGRRLGNQKSRRVATTSIPRGPGGGLYPLSFSQQRLWFLEQLDPGNVVYNLPGGVCLEGELDFTAFTRALDEVIRRHDILRTTFTIIDGQPAQRVRSDSGFRLELVDLSSWPEAQRIVEIERLAQEEADRPFDLERGPLMRASLVRLSSTKHVLLFNFHHIIFDGWSRYLLIHEVSCLYQGFVADSHLPLPDLPIQYGDFSLWQRDLLSPEYLTQLLDYWRGQLLPLPRLNLPTDHDRSAASNRAQTQLFDVDFELCSDLKSLAHSSGATVFILLLTAWQTLLFRYSGNDRICVGSPVANRPRRETEDLIGFFVNTLALCTDLSGDPSFKDLLERVREICVGAYAHQDVPFEKLVEELQPDRSTARTPFFQTWFVLHNTPARTFHLPKLNITPYEVERNRVMFDLMLFVQETEAGLAGALRYNAELFEAETITWLVKCFNTILKEVTKNPEIRLLDIPLDLDDSTVSHDADATEDQFNL